MIIKIICSRIRKIEFLFRSYFVWVGIVSFCVVQNVQCDRKSDDLFS